MSFYLNKKQIDTLDALAKATSRVTARECLRESLVILIDDYGSVSIQIDDYMLQDCLYAYTEGRRIEANKAIDNILKED
jgi:hypothetical protein